MVGLALDILAGRNAQAPSAMWTRPTPGRDEDFIKVCELESSKQSVTEMALRCMITQKVRVCISLSA